MTLSGFVDVHEEFSYVQKDIRCIERDIFIADEERVPIETHTMANVVSVSVIWVGYRLKRTASYSQIFSIRISTISDRVSSRAVVE